MSSETFDLLTTLIGMGGAALCGYLAGRQWRIKQLTIQLKKEIYEQAKLDGAFEFIRDSLFSSIAKRQPENGHSRRGDVKDAEK